MHLQFPTSALALVASLPLLAQGHPVDPQLQPRSSTLTANQILAIAPTSNTCANAPAPAQCRTAEQALPHIAASFQKYQVTSAGEQAALIALMAFETGDFKYNVNVYPGRPGQGTRNMQSAAMNQKYAISLPILSLLIGSKGTENPNAMRALLTANDDIDFGSAAWYLKKQCEPAVSKNLATGTVAGWESYITGCVQTIVTPERQAYYQRALSALHVS